MAIEISAKHNTHADGVELELSGICAVPNGGSVTLDEGQEAEFKRRYPKGLPSKSIFKVKQVKAETKEGGD